MKLTSHRVLDRLPAEEPCLGAVFTSYGFDPNFFENHVLRAVLRLRSDPVEHADRYHHEARRALQETPVVAIVDAGERLPGRRLPFDLLEVADRVFHPKAALLLYRDFARLLVGSGNLTFPGYGGNTELFHCVDLAYASSADASLLLAFDEHLDRLEALVRQPGTQLGLVREELRRRIPPSATPGNEGSFVLLDSLEGAILDQLLALLPAGAKIESIGMLAPFYERDDAGDMDGSIFGVLAERATRDAVLDVGLRWENPQIQSTGEGELEEGIGRLWTQSSEVDGVRALEHFVLRSIGPNSIHFTDAAGTGRRRSLAEVRSAMEARRFWMQPPPFAHAPRQALATAADRFAEIRFWLHPSTQLREGRPAHRPLHAKLLVLGYRTRRSRETLLLLGSPNMSRRALLMRAGPGAGNVELAVAFRLRGALELRDLVPDLVLAPDSAFELRERDFPEPGPNHALAIEAAIHDPAAQTLTVTWSPEAATLPPWRLEYHGIILAKSDTPPTAPVVRAPFSLEAETAEVVLQVEGRAHSCPILVTDLVALPAGPAAAPLALEELLLLLGRRLGAERAIQLAVGRKTSAGEGTLEAIFGEGFAPTDVFRAWWAVAEDLQDDSLSVQAFRLRLEGALGVGAAWERLLEAATEGKTTVEEAWFYGAELLRTLGEVKLAQTAEAADKEKLLSSFCDRVRRALETMRIGDEA